MDEMTVAEYVEFSARTENNDFENITSRLSKDDSIRLLHGSMGLCTEAGELLDALKKHIFYGSDVNVPNIKEELGDCFFYIAVICRVYGWTFEEIMGLNIKKLNHRYPDKFTADHAKNRDIAGERKILEDGTRIDKDDDA